MLASGGIFFYVYRAFIFSRLVDILNWNFSGIYILFNRGNFILKPLCITHYEDFVTRYMNKSKLPKSGHGSGGPIVWGSL